MQTKRKMSLTCEFSGFPCNIQVHSDVLFRLVQDATESAAERSHFVRVWRRYSAHCPKWPRKNFRHCQYLSCLRKVYIMWRYCILQHSSLQDNAIFNRYALAKGLGANGYLALGTITGNFWKSDNWISDLICNRNVMHLTWVDGSAVDYNYRGSADFKFDCLINTMTTDVALPVN